jgi:hypothetical protein
MIMTSFTQRSKSINFFQTTDFSNIDINFRNIPLMFVQIFLAVISAKEFSIVFVCIAQCTGMCIFQKHKLTNSKEKSKKKKNEKANKSKICT